MINERFVSVQDLLLLTIVRLKLIKEDVETDQIFLAVKSPLLEVATSNSNINQ